MKRVMYATTPLMCELADSARRHDFNSQLDMDTVYALDPEGVHVLSFSMLHKQAVPHMRTLWYVKLKDTTDPLKVALDITMDDFNNLLLTEEEVATLKETT